jgi:hypothetical protein
MITNIAIIPVRKKSGVALRFPPQSKTLREFLQEF